MMQQDEASPSVHPERQFFELPSGKKLAYIDFGPEYGEPVLLLHGTHGAATYFSLCPGFPFGSRWRMIGVDRPGYGESDMWRHGYAELAGALEALCRHLSLKQLDVVGVSAGGGCALACGAIFPSLVRRVVAIAPTSPMDSQIRKHVNRTSRIIYWLARNLPALNRLNSNYLASVCRDKMETLLERSKEKFSPADRREVDKTAVRQVLVASGKAGYAHGKGRGLAQDLENQANPWNFDLGAIAAETYIWASEDDTSAPPAMARHLHQQIPNSWLHLEPDAGHLWHICNMQQIVEQTLACS